MEEGIISKEEYIMTNMNFENRTLTNRVSTQMPPTKRTAVPKQVTTPDWKQPHSVWQIILDFTQPILLQLTEKRNVNLSIIRSQDQTNLTVSNKLPNLP